MDEYEGDEGDNDPTEIIGVVRCIPRTSIREFLIWETHAGGLAGHFGRNKTILAVEDQFFWPSLKRNVAQVVAQC